MAKVRVGPILAKLFKAVRLALKEVIASMHKDSPGGIRITKAEVANIRDAFLGGLAKSVDEIFEEYLT